MPRAGAPVQYEIKVIKVGEADVPGPEVYWMSHWNTWETLAFCIVLLRGGGHSVLINTGPPADLAVLNAAWSDAYGTSRAALRRTEAERIENALAGAGVTPDAVDYLLITPLQSYATANIALFPRATICISRRGWIEDFHAPVYPPHQPREFRIPRDVLVHLVTDGWKRVRLLADDEEVVPGIHACWVGAHHRSSMAYFVRTGRGVAAISDCFFKYRNLEENIPLGVQESMEECMRAYERIRAHADLALPLYDPEVFTRFPGGCIT